MLVVPFMLDFPGVVGVLVVFGALVALGVVTAALRTLVVFFEASLTCFFEDGAGT
jgi:hypothetical protein